MTRFRLAWTPGIRQYPLTQDMSITPTDPQALFRKSWTLYDAITARNYMFHRELYGHVAELLRERHQAGPYHILDLGCGNARFLAPCLKECPPESYQGVDLSLTALDEARAHLKGLPRVTFILMDMLRATEELDTAFDVIFCGFALHHLSSDKKQQLFDACARCLKPGGVFMMMDIVREEGQSREGYLEGYLGYMRNQWTDVIPEQLEEACAHVAAHDFPETLTELTRMAGQAKFRETRLIERFAQHHLVLFSA